MRGIVTINQQDYDFKTKFKEVHNNHVQDERIVYVYYKKPRDWFYRKIILVAMDVSYGDYKYTYEYKQVLKRFNEYTSMPIQQLMELISLQIELDILERQKKRHRKVNERNNIKNMYRRFNM